MKHLPFLFGQVAYLACAVCLFAVESTAATDGVRVVSPDGSNEIILTANGDGVRYRVSRRRQKLFKPSQIGPVLTEGDLSKGPIQVLDVDHSTVRETFQIPWGKTKEVTNQCSRSVVTLQSAKIKWEVELRAFDDGVAFRYRILSDAPKTGFTVERETTSFEPTDNPSALFNRLNSFTTSHESLYEQTPVSEIPFGELLDCPLLLVWPEGTAAAITEARVRNFAGMYLTRDVSPRSALTCRLSPMPGHPDVSVTGDKIQSPWRVIMLADHAGDLIESNLLLCLNEPPESDFAWVRPGKTTFHWWYGEFEQDYKLPNERSIFVNRHKQYIDFCADNGIAYHAVSGDGYAWYPQARASYGIPVDDADVRVARPELGLPDILSYASKRDVGIRLWVHWKALSMHLEEAMTNYERWGVKGLMVDFLNRDDQEMIGFVERLLKVAARHKIHIQLHGSSKYSGEQRTFPNLLNREGAFNLENIKWNNRCTPQHNVDVAFTRALAGPVDYHLGGLRCATREQFRPRTFAPVVLGTRCHQLALYLVYENPMPMVVDAPKEYEQAAGFQFLRDVPTTWDETRFVAGEPGDYVVLARRHGKDWYLGGITDWTSRELEIPLNFLSDAMYELTSWIDASNADTQPNELHRKVAEVTRRSQFSVTMSSGGGFVAILRPRDQSAK